MTTGTSFGSIGAINFMINPPDDTISGKTIYNDEHAIGKEVPSKEYKGRDGEDFSIKLFFDDSYANIRGHCNAMIQLIRRYTRAASSTGAPPIVFYSYGSAIQTFVRILEWSIVNQKRDFDNEIIRMEVDLQLQEYVHSATRTPREERGEQFVVSSGIETFRSLAMTFLGDPTLWKHISDRNRSLALSMAHSPIIPGGIEIVIPAWSEIAERGRDKPTSIRSLVMQ